MLERRRSNFYLIINDIFDMKEYVKQPSLIPTVHGSSSPSQSSPPSSTSTPSSPNELIGLEGNCGQKIRQNRKVLMTLTVVTAAYFWSGVNTI